MDCRQDVDELARTARVASALADAGLPVFRMLECDVANGLAVIEDLGDRPIADRWQTADAPHLARILAQLRDLPDLLPGAPVYDHAHLLNLAMLLPDQLGLAADACAAWQAALTDATAVVARLPRTLILRDLHSHNIHRTADPARPVVLIDVQDAGPGPLFYDAVSLIEDPRFPPRDPALVAVLRASLTTGDADRDQAGWDAVALLRHTRVLAVFLRLIARGRGGYAAYVPRAWDLWRAALSAPAARPLCAVIRSSAPDLLQAPPVSCA